MWPPRPKHHTFHGPEASPHVLTTIHQPEEGRPRQEAGRAACGKGWQTGRHRHGAAPGIAAQRAAHAREQAARSQGALRSPKAKRPLGQIPVRAWEGDGRGPPVPRPETRDPRPGPGGWRQTRGRGAGAAPCLRGREGALLGPAPRSPSPGQPTQMLPQGGQKAPPQGGAGSCVTATPRPTSRQVLEMNGSRSQSP